MEANLWSKLVKETFWNNKQRKSFEDTEAVCIPFLSSCFFFPRQRLFATYIITSNGWPDRISHLQVSCSNLADISKDWKSLLVDGFIMCSINEAVDLVALCLVADRCSGDKSFPTKCDTPLITLALNDTFVGYFIKLA